MKDFVIKYNQYFDKTNLERKNLIDCNHTINPLFSKFEFPEKTYTVYITHIIQ